MSARSPIQRPASTDNFLSEREVVQLLDDLRMQKLRAERDSLLLQNQISHLQGRLVNEPASPGQAARVRVMIHDEESEDEPFDLGGSRQAPQQRSPQGRSTGARQEEEGTSGEEDGDGAPVGGELDNFIRLRSYILHMQEGASLLLWREDGLQLCWFWIDKECVSLHWDIDEEPEGPGQPAVSGGGSILLQDIVDIVPLGAGPDQLTDHPTDSSFTITLDGARLDIVAPTSIDFQVWYFGLAFATRLRLNVLNASQSQDETETDVDDGPGGDWYGRSPQSDGSTGQFGDAADDVQAQLRRGAEGDGITLGLEESQVMLDSMEEQRRAIENLKKENQKLREVRRSKDEAISRLLGDLQEAQQARDAGDEGQGEAKTPATSQESDRNWHNREIYRVRKRNQLLEEIVRVKGASVRLLGHLLAESTE